MAIYLHTDDPRELLTTFKKKIDEKHILTWSYDTDGDFTHVTTQWKNQAWLRPKIEDGKLTLFIIGPKGRNITTEIYAVYHGRFLESMLAHCDSLFTKGRVTAMPEDDDSVA